MKIASGSFKRKNISYELTSSVRPTKERIRQAIFNILMHRFFQDLNNVAVLDCFAGSGALGFEALSLGASPVFCVEKDPQTANLIKKNAQNLGISDRIRICTQNILEFTNPFPFDIAFLDPPYFENLIPQTLIYLLRQKLLAQGAVVVLECAQKEFLDIQKELDESSWNLQTARKYGKIVVSFYTSLLI